MRSTARRGEPTITMMMKFELNSPSTCIYKSLNFIFAEMSITLETLNILAANISRFTVIDLVRVSLELLKGEKTRDMGLTALKYDQL